MRLNLPVLACATLLILNASTPGGEGKFEWKDGRWVPVAAPAPGTPAGDIAAVRQLLEQKNYAGCVKAAEKFLAKYPDDPAGEEAMMLAGEAEMGADRYYQAYEWFERQLRQYPGGPQFDRALERQYDIAEAFLAGKKRIAAKVFRMDARAEALDILSRIAEHAPGTGIAEKAMLRVADYHYSRGEHAEASQAYDQFLDLFPKSQRASYAMLQAAKATYACYAGPSAEDTPLLEARQRFRTFAERYPRTAAKENVAATLKDVDDALARKAFADGQFYERVGRLSAAAYYYKLVKEQYADSQWAAGAEQALVRLSAPKADKPRVTALKGLRMPWDKPPATTAPTTQEGAKK